MFFLERLFGLVLFVCGSLFCWRTLSVLCVGVAGLLGSLHMLRRGPPSLHGSVTGECAFCRWSMFGILSLLLGRTTSHIPDVGGCIVGIGVGE